ncbi:MAG TPA: DUF2169 domain-containing protein [Bordetella sp.]|nr:DUF2169 domain-containing protein [Bordetella sp.]
MKTVKPFRLSVLTRPYRWQRRDNLGIAVLALVELGDAPRLLPEQELWTLAGEEAGGVLDTGMPKPVPEVLATGYAYTRHQQDRHACAVHLKVDGIVDKPLLVFGDRYWLDGRPDDPRPFDAMRVDWSRAYGGPQVADNPMGIGAADETVNGVRVRRVPNIESPLERLCSPSQQPAPAGYGALGMDWPRRARHMGSRYDQDWLENDYPGFAPDMDTRFFQAAPPDQRAAGPDTPLAGAAYEIWNMHPEHQVLRGRLPDWRARCFVSLEANGTQLREIPLALSTAWFFPHRDRVVLIWHGCMPVREDDAADVRFILPALEAAGAPRETAHYEAVMARRLDARRGAIHAMLDEDLVPRELCAPWLDGASLGVKDRPFLRNQRAGAERRHAQARADLIAQGLDPDRYLAPLEAQHGPPALADLPDQILRMERELEEARRGEGADMARVYAEPELDGLAAMAGIDVQALRSMDANAALTASASASASASAPAPAFNPAALRRQLREANAQPWMQRDHGLDALARCAYLVSAQNFAAPPPMPPHRARRTRDRLRARAAAGADARGLPLAGADLSGMNLRGMDFRGADLAGADLTDACLDGCDFTEAVLAAARFARTSARQACFRRANLGGVRCEDADFQDADLSEARLDQAMLETCSLRGASLGGHWSKTLLRACDLDGARLEQCIAINVSLEQCMFTNANLKMCAFMESALQDCDFESANLTRIGFTKCLFSGATTFARADVQTSAFAGGADLTDACFAGASLRNSSLRGATLDGADFAGAMLEACDLSECSLRGADLSRVRAPRSLFVRADLDAASLRGATLIEATLSKATLRDTDLEEANLFRADVSQAHMDASTRMRGAYTSGAKRFPLRRAERAA